MKVKVLKEVEVKYLHVSAHVRYWEDSTVDGVEDKEGKLIPLRSGDNWLPIIDLNTGQILNWQGRVSAEIHYKTVDQNTFTLCDENMTPIKKLEDSYVISMMCPKENGYGDYIIMDIDKDGVIQDWKADLEEFEPNIEE